MYFNDEKNNTSLDKELNNKSILGAIKQNIKKFIIIIVGLILLLVLILIIVSLLKNKITFKLLGDNSIKLTEGSEYIEPGYIATDKNGLDISDEVIIDDNIDTSAVGIYHVIYKLRNKKLQRTIKVIEAEVGKLSIHLKDSKILHIKKNTKYIEPGYICIDSIDGDITNQVKVTGEIDTTTLGTYKIVYSVTNSTNVTTTVSRIVVVE